ncbi:T9SS-dependent M36 family metallopeptidase [Chryseobacterium fluminis]|uniref:T9SS-dependent M36 family metallopeptidase n=1 Tax=Chryseobacterium fluminis TaxID=2983606 RepID=UPI002257A8CA|nr:T9SS-dependent M36 family metallopeptidase [Chryseobacterium sp. MMS21-Ot14]UZT97671.1 T9SS-dependent M36 family metallopeptidase [Chryseobacterium sp. MMS21-Ot14]
MKLPILMSAFAVLSCSAVLSQENEQLIKDYISRNKIREYKKPDLINFIVDNIDYSKSLHGDIIKFQQTYNDIPVYNSVGTALIRDHKIVYYSDNFIKDYTTSVSKTVGITKKEALQKIASDLGKSEIADLPIISLFQKSSDRMQRAIERLVYTNDKNNKLRLAYEYFMKVPQSPDSWNYLIDAHTGEIINKVNLNLSCNFKEGAYSHDHSGKLLLPQKEFYHQDNNRINLTPPSIDNASYNVFALPLEAPTFGTRSIVNNPWIVASSPEGWHSDGVNHYTITRGNNVYAYEDKDNNESTYGISPDGGAARNFDFPYDANALTYHNLSASTTNLFYINNKIHDIFYQFGFTESARNFQRNNFGKGGLGNDEVLAQSQDGGGFNNANFATYPDNYNGIMQMYLWVKSNRAIWYHAPSDAVSRIPNWAPAFFGPLPSDIELTREVKLASIIDGCTALPAGELTGKIGLIESGSCNSVVKVKNAQAAGADAVLVYNDAATGNTIGAMFGTDNTIAIPSLSISNDEGEFIKGKLSANIPVSLTIRADTKYDGSFDNGIVTHEYGHGISNRLTGDGYSCLNPSEDYEQMGEGWSDFFALMLTNKPGDNASVARGLGTYALGQQPNDPGIRNAKYSPDFAVNSFTYGNTNGMEFNAGSVSFPNMHSIGSVWATMLWDLHWKYVEKYGYSSDVTANAANGSARVLQLVTDALKLQACNPTFIDGRNAIIAADQSTTGGADRCMIWNTFARRGLGVNASAGAKNNINDQVESFDIPADCAVLSADEVKTVKSTISMYPNPAKNEFFISFPDKTLGKVSVEIYDMSGRLVSSEDKISPDAKKAISTDKLGNGTYMVKVKGLAFDAASTIIVKK